ncbi:MAE_28990/MAE_18760 family HEPN-like nuclease [Geminocystis sp. GBBB08]|uniref:MAE_28990/MAE_18760 family HEPN-like nuclease n=1 Tax=Geminocystis sp. GBBB08 TaxID=2604140 RepID=UPI0027E2B6CF|nr:MAE_28990/MAE_18760 family HEPN-like nuclease [Geminocystis sp. GBBB08]
MQTVLDDFNERAKEVSDYVIFVNNLEEQKIKISQNHKLSKIDVELLKTLKATAYLLLYNLIESTMRNVIQSIFDHINSKKVSFNNLRKELKKYIWQNIKKRSIDKISENIKIIETDIILKSFDPNDIFSGNVDARKIKELSNKYFGFSLDTDKNKTKKGIDLLSIKRNRNDLAHGFQSFNDIGKSNTSE